MREILLFNTMASFGKGAPVLLQFSSMQVNPSNVGGLEVLDIDSLIPLRGFARHKLASVSLFSAPGCMKVIESSLVPLSLPGQFSNDSIVLRHTPWCIDLWASTSQFSSCSCRERRNKTLQSMMGISFLPYLAVVIFTLQVPSGFSKGRIQNRKQSPF